MLSSVTMDQIEAKAAEAMCAGCRQVTPGYEIVNYGSMESGYRELCTRCFNAMIAKFADLEGIRERPIRAGRHR